ncbi:MAG: hypothetical protein Q4C46_10750 [Bacillota bacterium]|nr:hypothetical protein [Bacillota bacterium]
MKLATDHITFLCVSQKNLLYLTKESKNFFHDKETSKFIRTYPKSYLSEENANKAATSRDIKQSFPDEYDINNDADDILPDYGKTLEKSIYSAGGNTRNKTHNAYKKLYGLVNFNVLNSLTGAVATFESLHHLNTLELYNYIINPNRLITKSISRMQIFFTAEANMNKLRPSQQLIAFSKILIRAHTKNTLLTESGPCHYVSICQIHSADII